MTKQQLIEDNMKLVYFVIQRYYPKHIHNEDIVQIGMVGLCKAAEKYDSEKGQFSTYATKCIRTEIRAEFRRWSKQIDTLSLNREYPGIDGEPVELQDFIVGDTDVDYVDSKYFYSKLTPLQQRIVELKQYGLNGAEIGRELGYCKEYIRQQLRLISHKWIKYMEKR
jgi:RNA polymerase sigma factor (sigma-70 family)